MVVVRAHMLRRLWRLRSFSVLTKSESSSARRCAPFAWSTNLTVRSVCRSLNEFHGGLIKQRGFCSGRLVREVCSFFPLGVLFWVFFVHGAPRVSLPKGDPGRPEKTISRGFVLGVSFWRRLEAPRGALVELLLLDQEGLVVLRPHAEGELRDLDALARHLRATDL